MDTQKSIRIDPPGGIAGAVILTEQIAEVSTLVVYRKSFEGL